MKFIILLFAVLLFASCERGRGYTYEYDVGGDLLSSQPDLISGTTPIPMPAPAPTLIPPAPAPTPTPAPIPIPISLPLPVLPTLPLSAPYVAAGNAWSYALHSDGTLWAWGRGNQSKPMQIAENVVSVATGSFGTMILKADGSLWGLRPIWDRADNANELGWLVDNVVSISASGFIRADGSLWIFPRHREETDPVHVLDNVVMASCAHGFGTFAITTDGTLIRIHQNSPSRTIEQETVMENVIFVSRTSAITYDGGLYTFDHQRAPRRLMNNVVYVSSFVPWFRSMVITADQALWGLTTERDTNPVKIMDSVAAAAAGQNHALIVATDGSIWALGSNLYGQLGNEFMPIYRRQPAPVVWGQTQNMPEEITLRSALAAYREYLILFNEAYYGEEVHFAGLYYFDNSGIPMLVTAVTRYNEYGAWPVGTVFVTGYEGRLVLLHRSAFGGHGDIEIAVTGAGQAFFVNIWHVAWGEATRVDYFVFEDGNLVSILDTIVVHRDLDGHLHFEYPGAFVVNGYAVSEDELLAAVDALGIVERHRIGNEASRNYVAEVLFELDRRIAVLGE